MLDAARRTRHIILIPARIVAHVADGDGPRARQASGFVVELRDAGLRRRGQDQLRPDLLVVVVAVARGVVGLGRRLGHPGRVEADAVQVVHAPRLVEGADVVAALVEAVQVVDAGVGAVFGDLRAGLVGAAFGAEGVVGQIHKGDVDFGFLPERVDPAGHEFEFEVGGGRGLGGGVSRCPGAAGEDVPALLAEDVEEGGMGTNSMV